MRIYIGNVEIAGYFKRLKDGFDTIGVPSDLVYLMSNRFYNIESRPIEFMAQKLLRFFKNHKKIAYLPVLVPIAMIIGILRSVVFIDAIFRYDVFILNSEPFFNFKELSILKWFNKKIIVVFLGTESRPAYLSGNSIQCKYMVGDSFLLEKCFRDVKAQHKKIALIEKYADFIINHPPTALFQQKPFVAWCHIGFPNDQPKDIIFTKHYSSRILKILHAPSNPVAKGSSIIEGIIHKLRNEGLPVEFVRLENVQNEKVLNELAKCDLVVDEMYSDIPIGGLGTEAAFALKPVINGGYYADQIMEDYPASVITPSCFCLPEHVESHIRTYIQHPIKRKHDAEILNHFVKTTWNSKAVAERYIQLLENKVPQEWMYTPSDIKYFLGYGIEKSRLQSFLFAYVNKYGERALFLDDKPVLKDKLLGFIYENSQSKSHIEIGITGMALS